MCHRTDRRAQITQTRFFKFRLDIDVFNDLFGLCVIDDELSLTTGCIAQNLAVKWHKNETDTGVVNVLTIIRVEVLMR